MPLTGLLLTHPSVSNVRDRAVTELDLHLGLGWLSAERSLTKHVNQNDANGYYRALGLSPGASRGEIKTAYRRLVQRLHPDRDGNEESFRFLCDVVDVLLDSRSKSVYDSVGDGSIYLGTMEREELSRRGFFNGEKENDSSIKVRRLHWACLTDCGDTPGDNTDAWIYYCWEASPAVGYRGRIRVGVVSDGPRDSQPPWKILTFGTDAFTAFQKGVEPNRLHALCAMIDLQKHLLNQIRQTRVKAHNRERERYDGWWNEGSCWSHQEK